MAGRPSGSGGELDDWFDELEEPLAAPAPRSTEEDADDWLAEPPPSAHRRPLAADRRAWVVAGILVVLLLVGLAAGGVFSGGGRHATTVTTTTQPTTTARTTTTTASALSVPTSTLKPGDTGAQVRALQRALKALGYSPGAIDGNYGPSTQQAVVRFQQASGLTADGIVGPKTLDALVRRAGP
jgi:putative peptidoglycan binding protein